MGDSQVTRARDAAEEAMREINMGGRFIVARTLALVEATVALCDAVQGVGREAAS